MGRGEGGVGHIEDPAEVDLTEGGLGGLKDDGNRAACLFGECGLAGCAFHDEVLACAEGIFREGDRRVAHVCERQRLRFAGGIQLLHTEVKGGGEDAQQRAGSAGAREGD